MPGNFRREVAQFFSHFSGNVGAGFLAHADSVQSSMGQYSIWPVQVNSRYILFSTILFNAELNSTNSCRRTVPQRIRPWESSYFVVVCLFEFYTVNRKMEGRKQRSEWATKRRVPCKQRKTDGREKRSWQWRQKWTERVSAKMPSEPS